MRGFDASLVERLDIQGALEAELQRRAYGFPSRTVEAALKGVETEVTELMRSSFRHGLPSVEAEIAFMSKPGGGLRPLSLLTLHERVLYRSIVSLLDTNLPGTRRTHEDWELFERGPMNVPNTEYIVFGDASHYYQYVDHGTLEEELISQTGDSQSVEALIEFLGSVTQSAVGLPQLYFGSDTLAEVFIDQVERELIRQGLAVSRYNDDFRIASPTFKEANSTIEHLAEVLRSFGLTLNENKTWIHSASKYPEWVSAPKAKWDGINSEVELDLREANRLARRRLAILYGDVGIELGEELDQGEPLEDEDPQAEIAAAQRALDIWARGVDTQDRLQSRINRRLLLEALKVVTRHRSPIALEYCKALLSYHPDLTPLVGIYLKRLALDEEESVFSSLGNWLQTEKLYLSSWQELWLLEPLIGSASLPGMLQVWAREIVSRGKLGALMARAALVLANHHAIDSDELSNLYAQLALSSQPDVVAAIARGGPSDSRGVRAARDENLINRYIVQWAESSHAADS